MFFIHFYKKSIIDTTYITIHVGLKNLRTDQYVVVKIHNENKICNWTFTKEIDWECQTKGRKYSNQFISLEIIVRGIKDDMTLDVTDHKLGVIVSNIILLFP